MEAERPPLVICLSGSTRFKPAFEYIRAKMTLSGNIVLGPEVFAGSKVHDDALATDDGKVDLDVLQMRKIDLADAVFVVNPGNVLEGTTKAEIAYALAEGKPVYYHEEWYIPEYMGDDTFWQATNYPLPENCLAEV